MNEYTHLHDTDMFAGCHVFSLLIRPLPTNDNPNPAPLTYYYHHDDNHWNGPRTEIHNQRTSHDIIKTHNINQLPIHTLEHHLQQLQTIHNSPNPPKDAITNQPYHFNLSNWAIDYATTHDLRHTIPPHDLLGYLIIEIEKHLDHEYTTKLPDNHRYYGEEPILDKDEHWDLWHYPQFSKVETPTPCPCKTLWDDWRWQY